MKTADEILQPYIETPFRHTKVVEKDNALLAMQRFADQFRLPGGMGWIAIKDQIPPEYERVIWFDSRDENINIDYFVWSQSPDPYVTHWMALPAKPYSGGNQQ